MPLWNWSSRSRSNTHRISWKCQNALRNRCSIEWILYDCHSPTSGCHHQCLWCLVWNQEENNWKHRPIQSLLSSMANVLTKKLAYNGHWYVSTQNIRRSPTNHHSCTKPIWKHRCKWTKGSIFHKNWTRMRREQSPISQKRILWSIW